MLNYLLDIFLCETLFVFLFVAVAAIMKTSRAAKRGAAPQHWFLQKIVIKKLRRVINKVVEKKMRAHKIFFGGGWGHSLGPINISLFTDLVTRMKKTDRRGTCSD